ncbi:Vegetative incompatibility protein HET-E-1 [Colletotrichum sidae]|uniref:Vegetative incompatibility protein HET-E-1 n=1 Tax=Colletotrichum sidae TaxID=1347389 RepID=A0A4R8TMV7_9PEZI|nr:Vegetative incompatibility protein HET-E-1 [Colletotrichum sidae]
MRLINALTLDIEDFVDPKLIPPYAILSHTWGDSEATFHDWIDVFGKRRSKNGFSKIRETCRQAVRDGHTHAWIDTVCIDKTSSGELSEAINSMFSWYKNAAVCYIYMADVPTSPSSPFRRSRWFTRGWTLQELIAPKHAIFYSRDWQMLGTKSTLTTPISEVTSISPGCLRGTSSPTDFSIAQIMSWASGRVTTRPEDQAYCLLGLFGVNMPMLYGEGRKAFLRLQEEIIKTSDDHSIFVCDMDESNMTNSEAAAPLAATPACFSRSGLVLKLDITRSPSAAIPPFHSITNAGLLINLPLIQTLSTHFVLGVLNCGIQEGPWRGRVCIPLTSGISNYHHRYIRVATPRSWFCIGEESLQGLNLQSRKTENHTKPPNLDLTPNAYTKVMISMPPKHLRRSLSDRFFTTVRNGVDVFFLVVFPLGLSDYRLHAVDPPHALERETSLLAVMKSDESSTRGKALLVFQDMRGEKSKSVAVYLEAALEHHGALEDWPRTCQVLPSWMPTSGLKEASMLTSHTRQRASWVGDVLVALKTTIPPLAQTAPEASVILLAELAFKLPRLLKSVEPDS